MSELPPNCRPQERVELRILSWDVQPRFFPWRAATNRRRLDDVVADIIDEGGEAIAFAGDVASVDGARGCVDAVIERYGQLDVLINNAGILIVGAQTDDMPIDKFDEHIRCNIRSAFLMTKFALPYLRETKGNIISAGSAAGVNGQPGNTTYGGTKAFLHAFMQGVAVEQARFGVRANCICPGPIDTAWRHKETGAVDEETEKAQIGGLLTHC